MASPGRGDLVVASPGRHAVAVASPGRGDLVVASPGRGDFAEASPGRGDFAEASPGRGDLAVVSPGCDLCGQTASTDWRRPPAAIVTRRQKDSPSTCIRWTPECGGLQLADGATTATIVFVFTTIRWTAECGGVRIHIRWTPDYRCGSRRCRAVGWGYTPQCRSGLPCSRRRFPPAACASSCRRRG